jgi:hypothetical protein
MRAFLDGDGIESPITTTQGKFVTIFNRTLIDLQKEYARMLFGHVNPYTGLAYKDDPFVVMTDLTNENSLFLGWMAWQRDRLFQESEYGDRLSPYYARQLDTLFNRWLLKRYENESALSTAWGGLLPGESLSAFNVKRTRMQDFDNVPHQRVEDNARFYYDVEGDYISEMMSFIKDTLGSRMLVTFTNQPFGLTSIASQARADFLDTHQYWEYPRSHQGEPGKIFMFPDKPMTAEIHSNIIPHIGLLRVKGKPLSLSEFNHNFPNSYQCEAPGLIYAFMNFIGGDAVIWHSYYDFSLHHKTPYQTKMFDIGPNAPVMTQMLLAKAFLKGDIPEPEALDVHHSEYDVFNSPWRTGADRAISHQGPPLTSILKTPMQHASFNASETVVPETLQGVESRMTTAQGQLYWDSDNDFFTVDNPSWQGALGYIKRDINLTHLFLRNVHTTGGRDFAAVHLVSLDDNPIQKSEKLVLITAARMENTGMIWNDFTESHWGRDMSSLYELGHDPVLVEPVKGMAGFVLDSLGSLEVWALDAMGNRKEQVETQASGDTAWMALGAQTMWYELHRDLPVAAVRPAAGDEAFRIVARPLPGSFLGIRLQGPEELIDGSVQVSLFTMRGRRLGTFTALSVPAQRLLKIPLGRLKHRASGLIWVCVQAKIRDGKRFQAASKWVYPLE